MLFLLGQRCVGLAVRVRSGVGSDAAPPLELTQSGVLFWVIIGMFGI